jgi:DNA-binding MurR/RpiR family transcriptional regulator
VQQNFIFFEKVFSLCYNNGKARIQPTFGGNMKTIIDRLSSYYQGLSTNEQKIADYIRSHMQEIPQLSIHELAEKTSVSAPTLSRFVRNIGYRSYNHFKISLSQSNASQDEEFFFEFSDDDSYEEILRKTFLTNISSLKSTVEIISADAIERALKILLKSYSCGFFGLGASSIIAFEGYRKFMRTPLKTFYNQDLHIQLMFASKLTEKDCALVISHSGQDKDILRVAEILKKNKVPLIVITSFATSPIVDFADVALFSISEEVTYRPEAFTSVVPQISLIEALFMMYGIHVKEAGQRTIDNIRKVIQDTRLLD